MIDRKLAIITIHDVNPSHSDRTLQTAHELNKLKIDYNLCIVPYYGKKYNLKDYVDFCGQIYSLLQSGNVELILHGLYHQVDGKLDDFDTGTKEEEKKKIQQGLDIVLSANIVSGTTTITGYDNNNNDSNKKLPRPSTFIPPAWHLSRQCIEALKELNFTISESMTDIEFIQSGKKYILHPVMNWDQQGDKQKNKPTLKQNKDMFYKRLFNLDGNTNGLFRMAIHPPYDPDEALADQIEMIKHLQEKEAYKMVKYSELLGLD